MEDQSLGGYDLNRVSQILQVPKSSIEKEIKEGRLECIKIGNKPKDIIVTEQQLITYAGRLQDLLTKAGFRNVDSQPPIVMNVVQKDETFNALLGKTIGKLIDGLVAGDRSNLKVGQALISALQHKYDGLRYFVSTQKIDVDSTSSMIKLLGDVITNLQNLREQHVEGELVVEQKGKNGS